MAQPSPAARSSSAPTGCASCTLAAVTMMASTKPSEHVGTWRSMPRTFLLPSMPRGPVCGPDETLCESRRAVVGSGSRPRLARTARVSRAAMSDQSPVSPKAVVPGKTAGLRRVRPVCQGPNSLGRKRQGQPAFSRYKQALTISRRLTSAWRSSTRAAQSSAAPRLSGRSGSVGHHL